MLSLWQQGSYVVRRPRRLIAAVSALILVFAQAVTAAHACSTLDPNATPMPQASQVDAAMPADCPEMAKPANSPVNICWSHCHAGPQVDAQDYVPAPLVAPQTALLVRLADPGLPNLVPAQWLLPVMAAPPPQLRFSRFLI
jgi:hypothetical protein